MASIIISSSSHFNTLAARIKTRVEAIILKESKAALKIRREDSSHVPKEHIKIATNDIGIVAATHLVKDMAIRFNPMFSTLGLK